MRRRAEQFSFWPLEAPDTTVSLGADWVSHHSLGADLASPSLQFPYLCSQASATAAHAVLRTCSF